MNISGWSMAWVVAAMAALPVQAQTPMSIAPRPAVAIAQPNSVTLRGGSTASMIQSLRVVRQYAVPTIRANPMLTLGRSRVNLAPVFADPRSPINLAQRLRALPHVEVGAEETQLVEVEQGLLLHHFVSYRVKPGGCTDAGRRAQLHRTGVRCFTERSEAERTAAFATPGDAHYIDDPRKRAVAIAQSRGRGAQQQAQIAGHLAALRATLADPAKRQPLVAKLGEQAVARLATLGDAELKAEMLNAGERKVEHVMFVPNVSAPADFHQIKLIPANPPLAEIQSKRQLMFIQVPAAKAALAQAQKAAEANKGGVNMLMAVKFPPGGVDHDLEPQVFLTGFTISHDYEWNLRIETTIDWCLIGCSETYYVEGNAGFNYGFGLRFPIRLTGKYHYDPDTRIATIAPVFTPINGGPADYAATGLGSDQIFNGKEIVAEVGAHAGAGFDLPIVGEFHTPQLAFYKDFTTALPGDFKDGQFTPPTPGGGNNPSAKKVFDDADLLGNQANIGVAGLQVFPEVDISLVSNALNFTLHDYFANTETPIGVGSPPRALKVDPNLLSSSFAIGNPVYNLAFQVTPGIQVHTYIDIDVWSDSWDWDIWFPQLAVQLPPGGVDFSCHANTNCVKYFEMSPTTQKELAVVNLTDAGRAALGAESDSKIAAWKVAFDARWLPQCVDEDCRFGIRLVSTGTVLFVKQRHDANPSMPLQGDSGTFIAAEIQAQGLVNEAVVRSTSKAAAGWEILANAVWSKKCEDGFCLSQIKALASDMKKAAIARQQQNPDDSSLHNQGVIAVQYGPLFKQEVEHSHIRATNAPMSHQAQLIAYDCVPIQGADKQFYCPADPAPSLKLCQSMVGREIHGCLPMPPKNFAPPPPNIK